MIIAVRGGHGTDRTLGRSPLGVVVELVHGITAHFTHGRPSFPPVPILPSSRAMAMPYGIHCPAAVAPSRPLTVAKGPQRGGYAQVARAGGSERAAPCTESQFRGSSDAGQRMRRAASAGSAQPR